MQLAAFLVQPHPEAAVLHEHVLDLHGDDGPDAGEAVEHEADQRLVAQIDGDVLPMLSSRARTSAASRRALALAHDVLRPAHRQRRIGLHDVACHQPVEEVTDGSEAKLHCRHRMRRFQVLDPCRHMHRLHIGQQMHVCLLHHDKNSRAARM